MPPAAPARQAVQFGTFELHPDARDLRKQGIKIKLQDRPFRVLEVLLERPGQIVTRDELRARVWPKGTFVEFDQGLYSAVARLRDILGDSPTSPRFVETVARRGYRFIAPVTASASALPAAKPRWQLTAPRGDRKWRKLGISALVGLIGATALLAALLGFNIRGAGDSLQLLGKSQIHSLAVLPFENLSADADEEYFADGMTDELITSLGRLTTARVVSRTSVMPYKKSGKPVGQVARDLNVDAVIEGTVERSGDRVRIRVQLIHASRDQQLWAQSYDRQRRDTLLLESDVARDITGQIQSAIEVPQRKSGNSQQVDSAAHEAY